MAESAVQTHCPRSVSDEDRARAQVYRLLAALLSESPSDELLTGLAALSGDDTALGRASQDVARLAGRSKAVDVNLEFNALFVGLGRGELLPYASYYLTGFLNEKPLADLRTDLMNRGVKSRDEVVEPEDHIGTLCEIMAGLITDEYACDSDVASQKAFFDAHIAAWAKLFFTDLEGAQNAVFYGPVGSLGRVFMDVEADAFAIQ
ncbi:molecular chaperone TorD [Litorivicinus lipolyticus]|uniref:Molecular chaperone TorD n=1 Tax=Litorivicinus lipolyticus TaxID=418701 RepID=A0A5Q2QE33_9GAMM|nr:molecular chaperone TorD family protein [Litorivicinus lipolyticus]QGG79275.1 molecular chaperone TorD [Litorivicinus lipolyticus]